MEVARFLRRRDYDGISLGFQVTQDFKLVEPTISLILSIPEPQNLNYIYREANACANLLAKTGCDQLDEFILFCTPPAHVLEVLRFDLSVDTRSRVIHR